MTGIEELKREILIKKLIKVGYRQEKIKQMTKKELKGIWDSWW